MPVESYRQTLEEVLENAKRELLNARHLREEAAKRQKEMDERVEEYRRVVTSLSSLFEKEFKEEDEFAKWQKSRSTA